MMLMLCSYHNQARTLQEKGELEKNFEWMLDFDL